MYGKPEAPQCPVLYDENASAGEISARLCQLPTGIGTQPPGTGQRGKKKAFPGWERLFSASQAEAWKQD